MKKVLSLILSILMLASITVGMSFDAQAAFEYSTLRPGESETVYLNYTDGYYYNYFMFRPSVSGRYYFYSSNSSLDLFCDVLDSDGSFIEEFDDVDYYKKIYNFAVCDFNFVAGRTYYFKVGYVDDLGYDEYVMDTVTLSRVAPRFANSIDHVKRIEAINLWFDIPSPGELVKDYQGESVRVTTWPYGYGVTDETLFIDTDAYRFKNHTDYLWALEEYPVTGNTYYDSYTLLYINGQPAGTMGDFEGSVFTVCDHQNKVFEGFCPASCTQRGYYDALYCDDCGALLDYGYDYIPKSATIRRSADTFTCNGNVQRPSIKVYDEFGNPLVYKQDFVVDYSDWNSTSPGIYYVTVRMIGDYDDIRVYPYTIKPGSANPTVKLNRNAITECGSVQRPAVTLTLNGKQLVYNKDFTVEFSNWDSECIGRYTVTAVGIGRYEGAFAKTLPYYINPKGTTFLTSAQGGFKGVRNGFTLKWNMRYYEGSTSGYQIQYSTRSDFKNAATYTIKSPYTTSATITGRAARTRYYVRIRTFVQYDGEGTFYSDWSAGTKSVVTL